MAIRRRELITGAAALAGLIWAGPPAFGQELALGQISQVNIKAARLYTVGQNRILVYRATARKFFGFIATCPHDETKLTAANLRGTKNTCPKDKSVFNARTGRKLSGPATKNLTKVPLQIANGFLIATLAATPSASPSADQLIESSKVPVGGGVKVESTVGVLMIVQPTRGKFAAYSAICTHAGCEVSRATAQAIICTCHNSQFSTASGAVLSGPAGRALKSYEVVERSGLLFLK